MNRAGREREFQDFVQSRWAALIRFGVVLTADVGRAEDLVQSALEKCWPRWSKIDAPERYVKTTMANLATSQWRRRSWLELPSSDMPEKAETRCDIEDLAQHDALWSLIAQLPPRMRAVIALRYVEDLTEVETARVLGCSVGTVKSQASAAMAKLRTAAEADKEALR